MVIWSKWSSMFQYQYSFDIIILKNHLLNLCSRSVNSQRFLCSQKSGVKCLYRNDITTILGLLGERYGWIPTAQQKSRAKHLGLYEYFQNIGTYSKHILGRRRL